MKKRAIFLLTALVGLFMWTGCKDDDDKAIRYGNLPDGAKAFVETYFPGTSVVYAEQEKDDGRVEYTVVLNDATKIQFDAGGAWTSVDCQYGVLPDGILLPAIKTHMAENYPNAVAYKVEREMGGYEVSIDKGVELIYTSDGTFVREDHSR